MEKELEPGLSTPMSDEDEGIEEWTAEEGTESD